MEEEIDCGGASFDKKKVISVSPFDPDSNSNSSNTSSSTTSSSICTGLPPTTTTMDGSIAAGGNTAATSKLWRKVSINRQNSNDETKTLPSTSSPSASKTISFNYPLKKVFRVNKKTGIDIKGATKIINHNRIMPKPSSSSSSSVKTYTSKQLSVLRSSLVSAAATTTTAPSITKNKQLESTTTSLSAMAQIAANTKIVALKKDPIKPVDSQIINLDEDENDAADEDNDAVADDDDDDDDDDVVVVQEKISTPIMNKSIISSNATATKAASSATPTTTTKLTGPYQIKPQILTKLSTNTTTTMPITKSIVQQQPKFILHTTATSLNPCTTTTMSKTRAAAATTTTTDSTAYQFKNFKLINENKNRNDAGDASTSGGGGGTIVTPATVSTIQMQQFRGLPKETIIKKITTTTPNTSMGKYLNLNKPIVIKSTNVNSIVEPRIITAAPKITVPVILKSAASLISTASTSKTKTTTTTETTGTTNKLIQSITATAAASAATKSNNTTESISTTSNMPETSALKISTHKGINVVTDGKTKKISIQISDGKLVNPEAVIDFFGNLDSNLKKKIDRKELLEQLSSQSPLQQQHQQQHQPEPEPEKSEKRQETEESEELLTTTTIPNESSNIIKSPRLKARSKSIALIKYNDRLQKRTVRLPSAPSVCITPEKKRRMSIAVAATAIQKPPQQQQQLFSLTNPTIATIQNGSESKLCKSNESLECSENLDESGKSKSQSPIDNKQGTTYASKRMRLQTALNAQTNTTTTTTTATTPTPIPTKSNEFNPNLATGLSFGYIKWNKNIGYLSNSNIYFRRNEFGIIELINKIDFSDLDQQFEESIQCHQKQQEQLSLEAAAAASLGETKQYLCRICYKSTNDEVCSADCRIRYNAKIHRLVVRPSYRQGNNYGNSNNNNNGGGAPNYGNNSLEIAHIMGGAGLTFSWEFYLTLRHEQYAAPLKLFTTQNAYPCYGNNFICGMKLEAIDPVNPSLFCVCTVVDKQGYRIQLHFDGYENKYDFWVNVNSPFIFTPLFCLTTNHQLQPPPPWSPAAESFTSDTVPFNWYKYASEKIWAPVALFVNSFHVKYIHGVPKLLIGMKLEAFDINYNRDLCVASISNTLNHMILITIDGCDDTHSFWADFQSPHIRPIGWHQISNHPLVVPPNFKGDFDWPTYLKMENASPLPENLLTPRAEIEFKIGMQLEVVDRKVPALIRPATIVDVRSYEIKVLYDNWPANYAYWIADDSPDIHPINWCEKTNHKIEFPSGVNMWKFKSKCGFSGCTEMGNAKYPEKLYHETMAECPYETRNWCARPDASRMKSTSIIKANYRSILKERLKGTTDDIQPADDMDIELIPLDEEPIVPVEVVIKSELPSNVDDGGGGGDGDGVRKPPPPSIPTAEFKKRLDVVRPLLDQYGPRMQAIYNLWKSNSKYLPDKRYSTKKNPIEWSVNDVAEYVAQFHKSTTLGEIFEDEQINGIAFLNLSQDDLMNRLHLRLGPSVKIYNQIVMLREEVMIHYMK